MSEFEIKPFDEIARLWKEDPDAAEEYHRAVIEDFILGLDPEKQERARALQWRIDNRVRNIQNAQVRLGIIAEMMWDSFFDLNGALNNGVSLKELDTPPDNLLTSDKWGTK